jgi:hypothetical protein
MSRPLLALVVCLLPACSFGASLTVPDRTPGQLPSCDWSPPLLGTAGAIALGVAAASLLSVDCQARHADCGAAVPLAGLGAAILSLPLALGALHGYGEAQQCEDQLDQELVWRRDRP